MRGLLVSFAIALIALSPVGPSATRAERPRVEIPADFPRFVVPGHEPAMETLRELYWIHYQRGGPLATLWDEWLSGSTLWPATAHENRMQTIRQRWAQTLSSRIMDAEGYVATHQHASIAHQQGWPFPFWAQGAAVGAQTWGWHFSLQGVPHGWHGTEEKKQDGWEVIGAKDLGIADHAWNLEPTSAGAVVRTPPLIIDTAQAPFMQLRWRAEKLGSAQPYIEWITEQEPDFSPARRFYFEPVDGKGVVSTMIPVCRSPEWKGRVTRLGVNFDNPPGAKVGIQALFTTYDTRHNINNQNFIRGCCQYFSWTRDLNFLRANLSRIRLAMLYLMHELGGLEKKCILAAFPGHTGRSGITFNDKGEKVIRPGDSIGHNYWDILPFGYQDAYATIHYYATLHHLAVLEEQIIAHPEWNLPGGPLGRRPDLLRQHAEEVKSHAGRLFWNAQTERFIPGIDVDGKSYDYGYTFLNLEAIHYRFANPEQARAIMSWVSGERIVEDDTSTGEDIYHWRFAPRASTKRNVEWYHWAWTSPETIPFGGQVQDGGAVLGFSYHDLMSRLDTRGPDDAWTRLKEIIRWHEEVQEGGGYRAYYQDGKRGSLQGGGTAGGLGVDQEFFESILVPQTVLNGFLGFKPRADGFEINPRLPKDWRELKVTRIHLHRLVLDVAATTSGITVEVEGVPAWPLRVYPPAGKWQVVSPGPDGQETRSSVTLGAGEGVPLRAGRLRLDRR